VDRLSFLLVFNLLFAASLVTPARSEANIEETGYWAAIEQELARLNLGAKCDSSSLTCIYTKALTKEGPVFTFVLKYSRQTDSIYIYVDRFLPLSDPAGPSLILARRLLELNREMVTAKLEWDKSASAIQLSTFVNTDSNFDRRAFRSQLVSLWRVVEQLWPELEAYKSEQ
jgi:hypothetical protein